MAPLDEIEALLDEQIEQRMRMLSKHPQLRQHLACGALGAAIGMADGLGVDVEEFLRRMRERRGKPAPLIPPPRS